MITQHKGKESTYRIRYPRKRLARGLMSGIGKILLSSFFRVQVNGRENFPIKGPLLVVGNHSALMESVMLISCSPWQIEMFGSTDIPHERLIGYITQIFGFIPIRRGRMERRSMEAALDVLKQNGIIGIFPEGGIWDAGAMQAQSGVSWLSYRSGASVLPIGFSGTVGAIGNALRFRRPRMMMNVGALLPPAKLIEGKAKKIMFAEYAAQVLDAIRELIPKDDPSQQVRISNESFELRISVHDKDGKPVELPAGIDIQHRADLTKVLHRPAILKIFDKNLHLPIHPLQALYENPAPHQISVAVQAILDYLNKDNPFLFSYRFGPKQGERMKLGLEELQRLAEWASDKDYTLEIIPIRRFNKSGLEEEIVQTQQSKFKNWM